MRRLLLVAALALASCGDDAGTARSATGANAAEPPTVVWPTPQPNHPTTAPDAGSPVALTPAQVKAKAKADAKAAKDKAAYNALLAKNAAIIECQRGQGTRDRAAAAFAKGWLEDGQDVYASAQDKCGTTLRIQWILCSRPTIYNLVNSDMGKLLKSGGFERVTCYDGIDTTWRDAF